MTPAARGRRSFLRCLLLALCGAGTGAAACRGTPRTHTVTMDATNFQPADLTIASGDTVVWMNQDLFPHTATAKGKFDSGSIAPDRSWQHTFTERGAVDYACLFHPTMTGTLRVE